jgi:hypothetical protein
MQKMRNSMIKTQRVPAFLILAAAIVVVASWAGQAAVKGSGQFKADFRTSGEFFTLMSGMKQGSSPHGKVQVWYSNDLKDLVGRPSFTAPVGAVSIKPFEVGATKGFAVMVKKEPGYDPENGDWCYEMRSADGAVQSRGGKPMSGKIAMCIKCHAAAADKDYLAGTDLR